MISYVHDGSENFADQFDFSLTDGLSTTAVYTATITITAVNDPPIANTDSATALAGYPVTIDLLSNDSDPDNSALSISNLTQPGNGTVSNNGDGTVTYTANPNHTGVDTFTYQAFDGSAKSAVTIVTVNVTPPQRLFLPMIIK